MAERFEFSYDRWSDRLLRLVGLGPRRSAIVVEDDDVRVTMGWAFRVTIPRSAIRRARPTLRRFISRGVHGWRGRWLVNGSGEGLVTVEIDPPAPSRVVGAPGKLRELIVSVERPADLVAVLGG